MLSFFRRTNINFVRLFPIGLAITGTMLVVTVLSLVLRHGPRYGIDFTGGALVQVHLSQPVSTEQMRNSLSKIGERSASIQQLGTGQDFLIRAEATELVSGLHKESFGTRIVNVLRADFPDRQPQVVREESVGPRIGKELQNKALLAVILGVLAILVYVGFRFDFRFGVGVAASLLHDAIVTIGFMSVVNLEISITTIAAVLTIIGFSCNDSIVVSDRVRENLRKMRNEPFDVVVNRGINETLSRTVITSLTVLFVTVVLLIFSPPAIQEFAAAMTFGIITGTYSSIFIVGPLVVYWEHRFPRKKRR